MEDINQEMYVSFVFPSSLFGLTCIIYILYMNFASRL